MVQRQLGKTVRLSFQKIHEALDTPNLIEVQKKSYENFLSKGMAEVLRDVSPITDYSGNLAIEFTDFTLDKEHPKYPVEECKERDVNYAAPLRVTVRLTNRLTGEINTAPIYMGDFPLMTDNGTFIINGAERVIVSQIVRSPGVYFDTAPDKSGKRIFTGQVIPYRGAWLEYETDANDILYVRIDKTRKIPATILIRALGIGTETEIKTYFGDNPVINETIEKDGMQELADLNRTSAREEALKEIYKKLRPGEPPLVESAELLINNLFFDPKRYDLAPVGRFKYNKKLGIGLRLVGQKLSKPIISPVTGELLFPEGTVLSDEDGTAVERAGVNEAFILLPDGSEFKVFGNGTIPPETVLGYSLEEAGIRGKVRTSVLQEIIEACEGDPDAVKELCAQRRDELSPMYVTKDDIFSSINYIVGLYYNIGVTDDIDHLGNRRLRCVGELLQNQMRIGFSRMDKTIKERMTTTDSENLTPVSLINIRPIVTAIREFFGSSPLSQFMDQANPLAELTHKRRLSALGPGGLSRDRASFDVRDVHYTHYGRICPVESPEGPNIGLISSLATFARINEYGFIEAPYRRVDKSVTPHVVTDDVVYLTADQEDKYIIAAAKVQIDEQGHFVKDRIIARDKADVVEVPADRIDFVDISPRMVV
ncbi:MAG: DNA-directed RNA polymerase subunit beta, partial [Clostridia bacterium]|nr:DNA-directed RNA polymerase subunit beta [Clostridia bacterium]